MPLSTGARLGPYEILAPLGAGGMGEVYKARDTRLDRIVAIKTSAAHFSERFEREARAVAAFNHPNICTLYDVGPDYLVMEYIEGAPVKGPMPLDQALQVAAQIAGALDAAHRKGIVHRDLKPANILLAKSGVKLLDFGLAKTNPDSKTRAPDETVTRALTQEGSIVGTLQYMPPEQLQAKDTDARSDIFSFGCVLYELLTGRRAFDGADKASIIAAILKDEPPSMTSLAPVTPPALDRLVRKCLAKDPDDRWQSARDLRDELLWIASGGAETAAVAVAVNAPASRKRERLAWIGALAIVGLVAAFALLRPHPAAAPERVMRFPLPLPESTTRAQISPDGEKVLYTTEESGKRQYWIYNLASAESRPLAGVEGRGDFSWSPDSRSLAFTAVKQLRKIDIATGLVSTLHDGAAFSIAWSPDGGILFSSPGGGVHRIPAEGGEAKELTKLVPPDAGHIGIVPLPDGRRFLFIAGRQGGGPLEVKVGSKDGTLPVTLMKSDNLVAYAAPGYLLYLKGDTLIAQPFDASRAAITGPPQPLIDQVGRSQGLVSYPWFSASQTGLLLYRHGTRFRQFRLTWFDRSGKESGTLGEPAEYTNPALSPDGARLAVGIRDPQTDTRDIWVFDLARGGSTRITFDPADDFNPVWSPDGSRIAYTSQRKGLRDLYIKNLSGTGQEELLLASDTNKSAEDWSPDGAFLSFNSQPAVNSNLWLLSMSSGEHKPTLLRGSHFREQGSSFSPDGKFITYRSDESGRNEIFAQSLAAGGGRWQISTNGGEEPQWRRDGKELFYVSRDTLMSVDIKVNGNALVAGIPHALFKVPLSRQRRNRYVVTRDGQRFLVVVPEKEGPPPPFIAVVNWPALLPKK
jgi:Tol biopolymer transport system component/tRNA A-37 threonylcarbamoyl transferase component Bud32